MKLFDKIIEIKKNKTRLLIVKNSSWLIGDKIYSMLIGIFVTAIVARYFGPENFGQFNYALSLVTLFTVLSTLGMETLTVKAIIHKEHDEGTILFTSLLMRIVGGTLLTILTSITIRLLEPNDHFLHTLVLVMSLTIVFRSLEVIEYWIQAYQRAKISSIIKMSAFTFISLLKLALVYFKGNLIHYSLIYLLDFIIVGTALLIAYFLRREKKEKWKINIGYAKEILSQSWYLILSGFLVTLYMRIDKVMLGMMMPSRKEVGIYSAASTIAEMWYFIPMAIIISLKPVIMAKKKGDERNYLKAVQLQYTVIAWIGIAFGVFIIIFSKSLTSIIYGSEFIEAASILSLSVWSGTFAMLGTARGTWLICEGLQKYTLIYIGSGAIINILLNYILIPVMGAFGAAFATLVSQVVVSLIVPSFFKETRLSSIMMLKTFKAEGLLTKNSNFKVN